eukprot:1108619-Pelagomonas_calceolata.AAC.2
MTGGVTVERPPLTILQRRWKLLLLRPRKIITFLFGLSSAQKWSHTRPRGKRPFLNLAAPGAIAQEADEGSLTKPRELRTRLEPTLTARVGQGLWHKEAGQCAVIKRQQGQGQARAAQHAGGLRHRGDRGHEHGLRGCMQLQEGLRTSFANF